jgi:hypothetical protein
MVPLRHPRRSCRNLDALPWFFQSLSMSEPQRSELSRAAFTVPACGAGSGLAGPRQSNHSGTKRGGAPAGWRGVSRRRGASGRRGDRHMARRRLRSGRGLQDGDEWCIQIRGFHFVFLREGKDSRSLACVGDRWQPKLIYMARWRPNLVFWPMLEWLNTGALLSCVCGSFSSLKYTFSNKKSSDDLV